MQIHSLSTENKIEIPRVTHRGFAICEFVCIINGLEVDQDGEDVGPAIVVNHLFRAIRIKTNTETWGMRGYSIDEVKKQIDNNLGVQRYVMGIPF